MDAPEFKAACVILWGSGATWARRGAEVLRVQERNVYYFAAGSKPIPPGIADELRALLGAAWCAAGSNPYINVMRSALGALPAASQSAFSEPSPPAAS